MGVAQKRLLKLKKHFMQKNLDIDSIIDKAYIDNDVAIVACMVSNYYDIINKYSVTGYEMLNTEFEEYLYNIVEWIPEQYPLAIELCGHEFSEKEQDTIRNAILLETEFVLADAKEEEFNLKKEFVSKLFGLLLTGVLILILYNIEIALLFEVLYILFWFFADAIISFIFGDWKEAKEKSIRAGRLASVQVRFEAKYVDEPLTQKERAEIIANALK